MQAPLDAFAFKMRYTARSSVHLVVNWRTIWAQDEPLCMFYVGTCPLPLPRCRVVP